MTKPTRATRGRATLCSRAITVIAILEPGSFFEEECLAAQGVQLATAAIVDEARIVRIDKQSMLQLLQDDRTFYDLFLAYMEKPGPVSSKNFLSVHS